MTMHDMRLWLDELRAMPRETEWLEFKRAEKSFNFDQMAQYVSALANEANLVKRGAIFERGEARYLCG